MFMLPPLCLKDILLLRLRRSSDEGLTLVELLVVIALVGVVAAIALPILINAVERAQVQVDAASEVELQKFVEDWGSAGAKFGKVGDEVSAYLEPGDPAATITDLPGGGTITVTNGVAVYTP